MMLVRCVARMSGGQQVGQTWVVWIFVEEVMVFRLCVEVPHLNLQVCREQ